MTATSMRASTTTVGRSVWMSPGHGRGLHRDLIVDVGAFLLAESFEETSSKAVKDTFLGLDVADGIDHVLFPLASSGVVGVYPGIL